MFARTMMLLSFTLVLGACASSSAGTRASTGARGARDVITEEELASTSATNALDAVRQLRPQMLQSRGPTTLGNAADAGTGPAVFLDGQRFGGLNELASISVTDIREIRYLSGPDATQRFGTGYTQGAILVSRKTGGRP